MRVNVFLEHVVLGMIYPSLPACQPASLVLEAEEEKEVINFSLS